MNEYHYLNKSHVGLSVRVWAENVIGSELTVLTYIQKERISGGM